MGEYRAPSGEGWRRLSHLPLARGGGVSRGSGWSCDSHDHSERCGPVVQSGLELDDGSVVPEPLKG